MKFFLTLVFLLSFSPKVFSQNVKNVLILNSYHKGFELSDRIIENIEKVFYTKQNININILYMNSKQIYTREYKKKLNDLYALQLKNKTYDLIIPIDKFAYKFVVKNYSNLFKNEAIFFLGVEQYSKELANVYKLTHKINGVIQKLAIEDNIKIIRKVIPTLKKLYILNDRSPNANDSSSFITKTIRKVRKDIHVEYLRDYTLLELKNYFKEYKEDEAILFVRFSHDLNGEYYRTNKVAAAIKDFELPVFATDTLFLGKGIIGGKLISIDNLGIMAGNLVIDILNKDLKSPYIKTYNSYKTIFDYKQLERFNISIPRSFRNINIINTPKSFFDKYRTLINGIFLVSPVLFIIIIFLMDSLYSKQKASRKLKQRLEFDYALLNAIDSAIFWQDKNGIILDMNKKFCQLVSLKYREILGNNLSDLRNISTNIEKIMTFLQHQIEDNFILKDKKGSTKIYYIKQTSFKSQDQEDGIVTIFTDITQEKRIELERVKQNQYMIQQSKMAEIGEIFSSIAHQWKSPLVTITSLAQDMFYSNNICKKEQDSYHIKNIMLQANYMTDTIDDFQDFIVPSKEKTIFNVHKTIVNMLNIVKHNMKYNYIDIKIEVEENLSLNIFGYKNEFMQAILNIINNSKDALLFNNEKNRKISLLLKNKYNCLIIDIIDNGPGIKNKNKKKIFQQYFSTKEEGHGIGLYMTRLIIQDKFHGKIYYKDKNTGSFFRIILKSVKQNKEIES